MDAGFWATNSGYLQKLVISLGVLITIAFAFTYLVGKIKAGDIPVPKFLKLMLPALKDMDKAGKDHDILLIQKEVLPDGSSLMVIGVDGRRILVSQHINSGIRFLTELDTNETEQHDPHQNQNINLNQEHKEEIFK